MAQGLTITCFLHPLILNTNRKMDTTPPHQPNANVLILDAEIQTILSFVLPGSILVSVDPVPTTQSYNNRILRLKVQQNGTENELVLKLNGRSFGPSKVQNEVACLLLLEAHCHQIPAPRVLAWSNDGCDGQYLAPATRRETIAFDIQVPASPTRVSKHAGWILMSKVPGYPLRLDQMDKACQLSIARQIADFVSTWRRNVPPQPTCGNLKLEIQSSGTASIEHLLKEACI